MKKILVLGAGRSSSNLIKYLLEHAEKEQWIVRVGDMDIAFVKQKTGDSRFAETFQLDASNKELLNTEVESASLVISMLPAFMHPEVATICLKHSKNLITPSYISDEMMTLDKQAREKGLIFLNEMGVDPGIDHMSAMRIIHQLKEEAAELDSFESFTGGLIAPESDNNPWNYKITWNPRNVVLAGYGGTARYQQSGKLKFIPYHRLFKQITQVSVEGYGKFDGYANRDSLKYKHVYGLDDIPTLYRGTLRRAGFCKAWDALVQIGLTDDSFAIENPEWMNWRSLTESFLEPKKGESTEEAFVRTLHTDEEVMSKLKWLGIFDDIPLEIKEGSPALALQKLIEKKWKLDEGDKDMIVMWHRFYYRKGTEKFELQSSLITLGDDPVYTAMSKTVGLPMAIAAKKILRGEIKLTGIHLPVIPEIYNPVLDELEELGIRFVEKTVELAH